MPWPFANPNAFAVFDNATIQLSVSNGTETQNASGIPASVLRGNVDVATVGAARNAEQWGVSFRLAAVAGNVTLPLLDWRDGTIRVVGGRSDVPVLTIQEVEENGTGTVQCRCSAKGRGGR